MKFKKCKYFIINYAIIKLLECTCLAFYCIWMCLCRKHALLKHFPCFHKGQHSQADVTFPSLL